MATKTKTKKQVDPKEKRQQATKDVADKLIAAGMSVVPYGNNPFGNDAYFTISIPGRVGKVRDGSILRLWSGDADISVTTNKKLKQAVLTVKEPEREIIRNVETYVSVPYNVTGHTFDAWWSEHWSVEKDRYFREASRSFPIQMPNGEYEALELVRPATLHSYGCTIKVRGVSPATETSFLVGIDETAPFVAQLPKIAKSVVEAHEILRPKGVPKDAPRQGEWFFRKASKKDVKDVENALRTDSFRIGRNWQRRQPQVHNLELGSSHSGVGIKLANGEIYYCGPIMDNRENHHSPLFLDGWYVAVRNTEVVMENSTETHRRNWD